MTLSITFYNNIKYTKDDFMNRDRDFFGNGVVQANHFPLAFPATPDLTLQVGAGVAWVDGYRIANDDSGMQLRVDPADSQPRIDIVQIGHDDARSQPSLMVKKGVPSATPIEPGADAGFLKLYAISVPVGATSISTASITDRRTLVPLNVSGTQIQFGGAVQNNDPAYLAVKNGTFVKTGTGLTATAGTNQETLSVNQAATLSWTGTHSFSKPINSTQADGTAPLTVASKTKVANLNADQVDGYDFDQSLKKTDDVTFNGFTTNSTWAHLLGGGTNGGLRLANASNGVYIQGVNAARNGSLPAGQLLYLSGYGGAADITVNVLGTFLVNGKDPFKYQ